MAWVVKQIATVFQIAALNSCAIIKASAEHWAKMKILAKIRKCAPQDVAWKYLTKVTLGLHFRLAHTNAKLNNIATIWEMKEMCAFLTKKIRDAKKIYAVSKESVRAKNRAVLHHTANLVAKIQPVFLDVAVRLLDFAQMWSSVKVDRD